MQYVIITFLQVIFSNASTSGFKSELIIRSLLHAFVAILKVLMRKVLARCKIVLLYRFSQNNNGKLLRCDFFALLPLKFMFVMLFLVPRSWTGSVQMISSMTFIRGNRCIEREKDTFKSREVKRLKECALALSHICDGT